MIFPGQPCPSRGREKYWCLNIGRYLQDATAQTIPGQTKPNDQKFFASFLKKKFFLSFSLRLSLGVV
jgi:hypothetical protein